MSDHTGGPADGSAKLQPGQTIIFLGDHTSPDNPGYVRVMQEVLAHFYPGLRAKLISAGSMGQVAGGLRSRLLMQIITSSRPDWLVMGVGLGDAMREPEARRLLEEYRRRLVEQESDEAEQTFGPELRVHREDLGPASDIGREPEPRLNNLERFRADLSAAIAEIEAAGVKCCLLTTIMVGNDARNPVNGVLRLYNKAIRQAATEGKSLLADIEKAFRDVLDRAASYKQKVALTGATGELNAQGEALVARTVLQALGMLPQSGRQLR